MLKKFLAVFCLVDDKGVIYKPEAKGRGWGKEERALTSNSGTSSTYQQPGPHTSNSQWNLHNRAHFPSWTLSSPYNQTTPSAPQYTENQPTQINTYTGTATTTSQLQKQCIHHPWHIGPVQFLPHRTAWTKNWTTSKQHSNTVSSPSGPSTSGTTGSSSHNSSPTSPPPPNNNTTDKAKTKATIVVPYIPKTSEKFKKV